MVTVEFCLTMAQYNQWMNQRLYQVLRTVPHWVLVTHMFNHQTHHRGQATTLLSQLGLDVGATDLPFMPQFSI